MHYLIMSEQISFYLLKGFIYVIIFLLVFILFDIFMDFVFGIKIFYLKSS